MKTNGEVAETCPDPVATARARAKEDLGKALKPLATGIEANRTFNERLAQLGMLAAGQSRDPQR